MIILRLNQCFGLRQQGYRKIVPNWLRGHGIGFLRRWKGSE
jgi:hypothetical protein